MPATTKLVRKYLISVGDKVSGSSNMAFICYLKFKGMSHFSKMSVKIKIRFIFWTSCPD